MNGSTTLNSPPVTDDLYGLVRMILRLSRRVHHVLDDPLETALGLNTKELLVLASVMDGADTPGAVAHAQNLPAPTVTRMVTKLVQAGLVRRVTDPSDLRLQRLELTQDGQATRARTRAVAQDIVHAHFGHLPPERVHAALAALAALDAALHAPCPTPGDPA